MKHCSMLKRKLYNLARSTALYPKSSFFGFIQGHSRLSANQLHEIETLIGQDSQKIVTEFERRFADLLGDGKAISFAAGRMGFFVLMKILGVGVGDEIILQGHTCSVMVNAVWRTGATPVFADIDTDTFGSSATNIDKVITSRTRMIVAQHSFGIPCNIVPIVELAKSRNIFLLEDCALTLQSQVNRVQVGNFSDAALFSTDHSKPLNTFLGGLIYTRNDELYERIKKAQSNCDELSYERQSAIWEKFLFEREYYNPQGYGKSFLVNIIKRITNSKTDSYLIDDNCKEPSCSYPYPARLPSFLGKLGLFELRQWSVEAEKRAQLLTKYLKIADSVGLNRFLPQAYFDNNLKIIPLRFVFAHPDAVVIKRNMKKFIDTNWFWFDQPIVTCEDPSDLGYEYGSCPNSENIGRQIINWPCIFDGEFDDELLKIFTSIFLFQKNNH
jgi:perosamine synthetase